MELIFTIIIGVVVTVVGGLILNWLWERWKKESANGPENETTKPLPNGDVTQIKVTNPDPTLEAEIQTYREKTESLHSSLPVAGFAEGFKVPIDIEDIYIPLRAMVNLMGIDDIECFGDSCTAHEHFSRSDATIEISLLDAFGHAEKRERKT